MLDRGDSADNGSLTAIPTGGRFSGGRSDSSTSTPRNEPPWTHLKPRGDSADGWYEQHPATRGIGGRWRPKPGGDSAEAALLVRTPTVPELANHGVIQRTLTRSLRFKPGGDSADDDQLFGDRWWGSMQPQPAIDGLNSRRRIHRQHAPQGRLK